jgi:hypothetical protein
MNVSAQQIRFGRGFLRTPSDGAPAPQSRRHTQPAMPPCFRSLRLFAAKSRSPSGDQAPTHIRRRPSLVTATRPRCPATQRFLGEKPQISNLRCHIQSLKQLRIRTEYQNENDRRRRFGRFRIDEFQRGFRRCTSTSKPRFNPFCGCYASWGQSLFAIPDFLCDSWRLGARRPFPFGRDGNPFRTVDRDPENGLTRRVAGETRPPGPAAR